MILFSLKMLHFLSLNNTSLDCDLQIFHFYVDFTHGPMFLELGLYSLEL